MIGEQSSRPELNEGVRRALAARLKDTFLPLLFILIGLAGIIGLTVLMVRWLPPDAQ